MTVPSPQTTLLHLAGNDSANISIAADSKVPSTTLKTTTHSVQIEMSNSSVNDNSTTENDASSSITSRTYTVKIVYLAQLCAGSPHRLSKENLAEEVMRIRAAEHVLSEIESAMNNGSQTQTPSLNIKLSKLNFFLACLMSLKMHGCKTKAKTAQILKEVHSHCESYSYWLFLFIVSNN